MSEGIGITLELDKAVNSIVESAKHKGVEVVCVIAFGSRAKEMGKPESDLDTVFLCNFGASSRIDDVPLMLQAQRTGKCEYRFSGDKGMVHAFILNWGIHEQKLAKSDYLEEDIEIWQVVGISGKIIYGEEPEVRGKKLLNYLKGNK